MSACKNYLNEVAALLYYHSLTLDLLLHSSNKPKPAKTRTHAHTHCRVSITSENITLTYIHLLKTKP